MTPPLRGLGPSMCRASSSSATSASLNLAAPNSAARGRYSDSISASDNRLRPADLSSAFEPNRSCNNSAADNAGQMRNTSERNSGISRSRARAVVKVCSSSRIIGMSIDTNSPSTARHNSLCRRLRRAASFTTRAVSPGCKRRYPPPYGNSNGSFSARCRSRTARCRTSTMRKSPFVRRANGVSTAP